MTSPTHRPEPTASRRDRAADALISTYVRELLSEDDGVLHAASKLPDLPLEPAAAAGAGDEPAIL